MTHLNNAKPGDIILSGSNTWLSRIIKKFMRLYSKKQKVRVDKVYSHAAMVINLWDNLYVAEAEANGINIRPLFRTYGVINKDVLLLTPKKKYLVKEQEEISKVATKSALVPTRYDYFSLLHQVRYIMTGKWPGSKGSKANKRLYCTEAAALWANMVRPKTFDVSYSVNPVDIQTNKYYKVK